MQDESRFIHLEYESRRSFEGVVSAFESAVGPPMGGVFGRAVQESASPEDLEARMHALEGPSGFMNFLKLDHGAWMARLGLKTRANLYIIGNPLIARTMIEHNIGVGLNVPVRVLIYEDPRTSTGRLAYDLPSSLMGRLGNTQVTDAARRLDEKLAALATIATGTSG